MTLSGEGVHVNGVLVELVGGDVKRTSTYCGNGGPMVIL